MKKEEKSKTVVVLLRALLDTRNYFFGVYFANRKQYIIIRLQILYVYLFCAQVSKNKW